MNDIQAQVIKILKENTGKTDIADTDIINGNFTDLGINSLSFIKIVVALEEAFNVQFDDSQINFEMFGKIETITGLIEKMMKEKN